MTVDRVNALTSPVVVMLAATASCLPIVACGGDSSRGPTGGTDRVSGDSGAETEDAGPPGLDFIRFTQGGSFCFTDCTTVHGAEAPATLVLEDAEGKIELEITSEEFELIESLARNPMFAQTVEDSLAGRDCGGFDILLSMTYQWRGEAAQEVPHVDSCGITEGYVLRDLLQAIYRLKEKYLGCPVWEEPPGFNLSMDPLPQRPLCWFCYGKCMGSQFIVSPSTNPPAGGANGGKQDSGT